MNSVSLYIAMSIVLKNFEFLFLEIPAVKKVKHVLVENSKLISRKILALEICLNLHTVWKVQR